MPRKDVHKHLGLSLDSKLSFKNHINEKINKANKIVGILKYMSTYIPLKTLLQMYQMLIRPLFDYGDVIYHIPHSQNLFDSSITLNFLMARIEKVQYHATLAMTGCWRGTSQNKLYDELGLESLADRRWARRLIHFFKIDKNMTPNYLKEDLIPLNTRSLRNDNPNGYREIMCSTSRYKNSFFPDSIRSWNNVGIDLIPSHSINIFKKNVFLHS